MQRVVRGNPCSDLASDQLDMLREIAKMQMGRGLDYDSKIMDKARDRAQKRFREAQERREAAEASSRSWRPIRCGRRWSSSWSRTSAWRTSSKD